jgi:hypothetical protein
MPLVVGGTLASGLSTADSPPVGARRELPWPLVTPYWLSPIIYGSARATMKSYVAITSISGIAKVSSVVLCGVWKGWATKSPSTR